MALIDRHAVAARVGVTGTTISRWVASKNFPRPMKLGPRTKKWRAEVVDAWLDQREKQARAGSEAA